MAVRDLFGIVDPVDVRLESEYMTVLLVVVPKYSMKEWETTYESLNQFVVRPTTCFTHGIEISHTGLQWYQQALQHILKHESNHENAMRNCIPRVVQMRVLCIKGCSILFYLNIYFQPSAYDFKVHEPKHVLSLLSSVGI